MLSIDAESVEVVERRESLKESFMVNQFIKVLPHLRPIQIFVHLLNKELVKELVDLLFSTPIGLDKTEPINISSALWLTQLITPLEIIQESTGSVTHNIKEDNSEGLLLREGNTGG